MNSLDSIINEYGFVISYVIFIVIYVQIYKWWYGYKINVSSFTLYLLLSLVLYFVFNRMFVR